MSSDEAREKITIKQRGVALWEALKKHPVRNAVISGACVILVVTGLAVIPQLSDEEIQLVDDYLAALQQGDAEAAIAIADGGEKDRSYLCEDGHCDHDDSFLIDEALRTDWEYESPVLGHKTEDGTQSVTHVSTTLSHGDQEVLSGFNVVQEQDQMWLRQPYAIVNMASFEIQPVSMDNATLTVETAPDESEYFVFPGPHRMMADSTMYRLPKGDTDVLWATEAVALDNDARPKVQLRNKAQTAAQQGFEKYLDECATESTITPSGCPFGAHEGPSVETSSDRYENIKNVKWEITTYPQLEFTPAYTYINARDAVSTIEHTTTAPGYAVITADSEDGSFEAECEIRAEAVEVSVPEPMKFEFSSRNIYYRACAEYE